MDVRAGKQFPTKKKAAHAAKTVEASPKAMPTSESIPAETGPFDTNEFVKEVERKYLRLGESIRRKGVDPRDLPERVWASANDAFENIQKLSDQYQKEPDREARAGLSAHIQRLGIRLEGRVKRDVEAAAKTFLETRPEAHPPAPSVVAHDTVAERAEAAELLKKMREHAGMKPETAAEEAPEQEAVPSESLTPEQFSAVFTSNRRNAEEPLPSVFHSNRRPRQEESPIDVPLIPNPEDAVDPEHVQEILREGTPEEKHSAFRAFMKRASEKLGGGASAESPVERLAERSKELDAEAKNISGVEKWFRGVGERYNEIGWKQKLAIGLSLGIGAGVLSAVSMPAAFACLSLVAAQRISGLAGAFLNYEKSMQEGEWKKEKAMAKAIGKAALMTGAMLLLVEGVKESVEYVQTHHLGDVTEEWLKQHWPFDHGAAPREAVGKIDAPAHSEVPQNAAAAAAGESAAMAHAPEMPTVGASSHGYEGMLKDLWGELHKHALPGKVKPGSDLAKLLSAHDTASLDSVVHDIAKERGFFHDGASVRIDTSAHMTIGTDGQLHFADAAHPDIVNAGPDMHVLPVAHEAPVPAHPGAAPATELPPTETITTPEVANVDVTGMQPPAPVETAIPHPVIHEQGYLIDSHGNDVLDGQGAPIHTGSYEPPVSPEHLAPASESVAPPVPAIEHMKEFLNQSKLPIDPLHGHVFQTTNGTMLAYGNAFDTRFNAAQEYVNAHHDAVVWVQAEKPVFYNGAWRPWVFEVRHGGFWRGAQAIIPSGLPEPSHIGGINPDTFVKQLDR